MTILPRCPRCEQPLAIIEDGTPTRPTAPTAPASDRNRPTFDAWMAQVDDVLVRKVGVSVPTCPTCPTATCTITASRPRRRRTRR